MRDRTARHIRRLLGDKRSLEIARAVPGPTHAGWKRRDYAEQARLGQLQRTNFESVGQRCVGFSPSSTAWRSSISSLRSRDVEDLIGDPHFTGAGPLVTLRGGHLALHTDFNRDSTRHLDRAVTALYYAPLAWDEGWGGELELWDRRERLRSTHRATA